MKLQKPAIFTRYIAKTLLTFFVGVVGILMFVIFMNHFIRIMDMAMTYGTSWVWIVSSLFNVLPNVFTLAAPMAFQIAILLTLTSMSEQGEMIALRAAGFSFKEIIRPMLFCAIVLTIILFFFGNWVAPRSYQKVLNLRSEARGKITKVTLEPKTFLNLGEWDLYLENLEEKSNIAKQIHLIRKNDKDALSTKVNASEGKILLSDHAIGLQLKNGQMQRIDAKDPTAIIAANFDQYTMSIALTRDKERSKKVGEFTTTKIFRLIKKGRLTPEDVAEYRTEVSTRNVMAFAPLILLLVSCPLGFSLGKRSNKGWGMLFSVIIIFSFYLLMTLGLSLGKKIGLLAYPAPWLPIFVGAAAAWYLWKKRLNI
ncbi:MAG: LptF/LptG family permease [Elusimicrobiaceae bacterium]|nr:LptF/LptG family permease [Elusimicrobiaceae bacterium]